MKLAELPDVEEKLDTEPVTFIPRHTRWQRFLSAVTILVDGRANLPPRPVHPGSPHYPHDARDDIIRRYPYDYPLF
jgi:hypothetical protein